jgi:small subunit ribosomal protein S24e
MEMKIISDQQNKLLDRREVIFEIQHSGEPTPSRKNLQAKLAAKLSVDDKMIVVQPLDSEYGVSITKGVANIYKTDKSMNVELAPILKRNRKEEPKKEEPKKEEPKKEEPATPAEVPKEVPKEEKKEEAKPEEKKEEAK